MGIKSHAFVVLLLVTAVAPGCNPFKFRKAHAESTDGGDVAGGLTGKSAPQMTQAQARTLIDKAMADSKSPKPDCARISSSIYAAVPHAYDKGSAFPKDVITVMAKCAEHAHDYSVMRAGVMLLAENDPAFSNPGKMAMAEIGLGDPKLALTEGKALEPKNPKDPELAFARSIALGELAQWPDALGYADQTVKLAASDKSFAAAGEGARANAYIHLGDVKKAEGALARADKLGVHADSLKKKLVPMRATKSLVETQISSHVYLGVYHLLGKNDRDVATIAVSNFGAKDREYRVELEIPGVTEHVLKKVTVLKGKTEQVRVTPPLRADFKPADQRAPRTATLNLKITAGDPEQVIAESSESVELSPRDYLPLSQRVGEKTFITNQYMAAWVTPNVPAIDAFLKDAKQNLPKGVMFSGSQQATIPQVKALFTELKKRGMSYVMDPDVGGGATFAQRTRLPSEVLSSTNAQCLEGTLLFATLLEAIGLEPILVRVPGHAFVGWKSHHDGDAEGAPVYLETTMVGSASFEEALEVAKRRVASETEKKAFEKKMSFLVDVSQLRRLGVTPQPML